MEIVQTKQKCRHDCTARIVVVVTRCVWRVDMLWYFDRKEWGDVQFHMIWFVEPKLFRCRSIVCYVGPISKQHQFNGPRRVNIHFIYSNFTFSRQQTPISAGPTLAHRLRRWTNVKTAPTLSELMNGAVCHLWHTGPGEPPKHGEMNQAGGVTLSMRLKDQLN